MPNTEIEKVTINLSDTRSEKNLLELFGEVFQFGGPKGNIPCGNLTEHKGWGMNWDALFDSMSDLGTGGIWGNAKKFNFPLVIELQNFDAYESSDSKGAQILREILDDTKRYYANDGKSFDYIIT